MLYYYFLMTLTENQVVLQKDNLKQDLRTAGLVFFIGFLVIAGSGVGYVIGYLLDQRLNTAPWLVVVFVSLGTAGGFLQAFRIGRRHFKK